MSFYGDVYLLNMKPKQNHITTTTAGGEYLAYLVTSYWTLVPNVPV